MPVSGQGIAGCRLGRFAQSGRTIGTSTTRSRRRPPRVLGGSLLRGMADRHPRSTSASGALVGRARGAARRNGRTVCGPRWLVGAGARDRCSGRRFWRARRTPSLGAGAGAVAEAICRLARLGLAHAGSRRARIVAWCRSPARSAAAAAAACPLRLSAQPVPRRGADRAGRAASRRCRRPSGAGAGAARSPSGRAARGPGVPADRPGALGAGALPLLIAVAGGVVFVAARCGRTRRWPETRCVERSLASAGAAFLSPAGLAWRGGRSALPIRWRARRSLAGGGSTARGPLALAVTWNDNLRFAPWTDILGGRRSPPLGIGAGAWLRARRPPVAGRAVCWAAAVGVSWRRWSCCARRESEPARKAGSARAALVGAAAGGGAAQCSTSTATATRGLLGGGDCDDRDPDVHPGALDLPGDGIDADCDGEDATDALPPPRAMAELPAARAAPISICCWSRSTRCAPTTSAATATRGRPRRSSTRWPPKGALFENGWAHAPSTRYSMPAIATGRWPSAITWDESIWWPRLGPDVRTTARGAARRSATSPAGCSASATSRSRDHRGFERGMDYYHADRAALHVAVNGPMESRGSSSREMTDDAIAFVDAHRDQQVLPLGALLRSAPRRTSRTRRSRRSARRASTSTTARSASPICTSGACSRICATAGPVGQDGGRRHRRSRRRVRRARRHRARLRPLHGADQGAVHRARARAGAAAGARARPGTSTSRRRC